MAVTKEVLGTTPSGETVTLYKLRNKNGLTATVSDFGAVWTGLLAPDRNGNFADVVLGYDTAEGIFRNDGEMGAIVGRNANRIKNAEFTLNGKTYRLAKNNGENNLHSGPDKLSKRLYAAEARTVQGADELHLTLHSPDGDQGYPGSLEIGIIYTLTDENDFMIEYKLTAGMEDTLANFTCHPYFNLAGHDSGNALGQIVRIEADRFCEAAKDVCPTGRLLRVDNTPFDFRTPKALSRDINVDTAQLHYCGGYDHNFCLRKPEGKMELAASAYDEASGRYMEIFTSLPGLQLYTGNFLNPEVEAKGGAHYHPRDGYAFEAQYYPNAINEPEWDQPVIRAGETKYMLTTYKFSVK
ncbi:MAG: aldose epimerase family protein [Eubacteriales bacterium]|nr:aldose epimerase family protein [Eubacteriales bacterium]